MPTRTGNFPIGFRRGWSDWQKKDARSLANWAKENGFDTLDLMNVTRGDLDILKSVGLRIGSVDLLDFGKIMSNDAGFGRKIYDPAADSPEKYLQNAYLIAKHLALAQTPEGQVSALKDLVKGEGDAKVNALQAFGPFAGVTFSKGAPGGPAVGEMYASRAQHEFRVNQALPDIRKMIQRGDIDGAIGRMTELDVPQGLQRFYIKTTLNPATRMSPRAVRDFYLHATPEQRERFERAQRAQPQQPPPTVVPPSGLKFDHNSHSEWRDGNAQ